MKCFIGTWEQERNAGVRVFAYEDFLSNKEIAVIDENVAASYIAANDCNNILYCIDERVIMKNGKFGGRVLLFDTESLQCIQIVNLNISLPCYLQITCDNKYMIVSNLGCEETCGRYNDKIDDVRISVFRLNDRGVIDKLVGYWSSLEEFSPSKNISHLHSCIQLSNTAFLVACDIGMGCLHLLHLQDNNLEYYGAVYGPNNKRPRYIVQHPFLNSLYVNDEMTCEVYRYHFHDNELEYKKSYNLFDEKEQEVVPSKQSDMLISSNGKVLYCCCRNKSSISAFLIDDCGDLHLQQVLNLNGNKPRSIVVSPDNDRMLISCTEQNLIIVASIDNSGFLNIERNANKEVYKPSKIVLINNEDERS